MIDKLDKKLLINNIRHYYHYDINESNLSDFCCRFTFFCCCYDILDKDDRDYFEEVFGDYLSLTLGVLRPKSE